MPLKTSAEASHSPTFDSVWVADFFPDPTRQRSCVSATFRPLPTSRATTPRQVMSEGMTQVQKGLRRGEKVRAPSPVSRDGCQARRRPGLESDDGFVFAAEDVARLHRGIVEVVDFEAHRVLGKDGRNRRDKLGAEPVPLIKPRRKGSGNIAPPHRFQACVPLWAHEALRAVRTEACGVVGVFVGDDSVGGRAAVLRTVECVDDG